MREAEKARRESEAAQMVNTFLADEQIEKSEYNVEPEI